MAGQLQALLDETDFLDPFQSGFRLGFGTETALVALYDDLAGRETLLDFSVAFSTIDHGVLLDRLAGLGVGGTVLQWFNSFRRCCWGTMARPHGGYVMGFLRAQYCPPCCWKPP